MLSAHGGCQVFRQGFIRCVGTRQLPLAAHRWPSTLVSWCRFERGGVQDGRLTCRALLLVELCRHIPSRGGASSRFVALRHLRQGKPWQQHA